MTRRLAGATVGAIIGAIIGAVRLLLIAPVMLFGLGVCAAANFIGRGAFDRIAILWCRVLVALLGVRRRHRGAELAAGALIVSNHISWLDTLLLGANWPVVFLAKSEIAEWPALGYLARRAGTLFIERGRGADRAMRDIAGALAQSRSVALFPEGRTSDGRGVRRFQPRLLQAAINAGAPVQPAAVRYYDRAGRVVTRHSFAVNTLPAGVWKTVAGRAITAEITLFAPLPAADRQTMARRAEELVRGAVDRGQV